MSEERCPLLIYQMGKVASSALLLACERAGVPAAQTHFLGLHPLSAMLKTLLQPELNAFFVTHIQGQLTQNIALTRRLVSARHAIQQQGVHGSKVKLISLSREPLDWYLAEFVQNYAGYENLLRRYGERSRGGDGDDDLHPILRAHRDLLDTMAEIDLRPALRPPFQTQAVLGPAFTTQQRRRLLPMARNLLKPVLWFQRLFTEPTGIDIFADTPRRLAEGVLHYENASCEALVIRYENLNQALPTVGRFVGVPGLRLPRANVSAEKGHYRLVRDALAPLELPQTLARSLYQSDYCRLFGYAERCRF